MRTLYTRIVVTFIFIALISSIFALFVTNAYYTSHLRTYNEQKITRIGSDIRSLYEQITGIELRSYLTRIAGLGYQIYAVNSRMEGTFFGAPFKHDELDPDIIRRVLNGGDYQGIMEEKQILMVTGFFENSLRNTAGLPLNVNGENYALFIRPNLEEQIGEVRLLMGFLLGFTFLFSIILIIVLTRFIVKPLQQLTEATNKIVEGDYNIELDISRRDEIGNAARHFTQMASSLKKLDEMRQEFVANVSHEIQSPLTSIQGFAQTMLDKQATPEEAERYLKIIEEESKRLSGLGKQLLTLAALDKEDTLTKRTAFRLDEQIRQALLVTEWQWTEKRLELELELPDMIMTGDAQLLVQVWLNLMTNAIKFSHPGGTLRITARVEQEIVVEIGDTGMGISEDELPYIFERFYKADQARNRTRSGSGLGLSITRKIVELHGGSIQVQSRLGKGSTFIVHLPRLP
ncbi:HAMP domain-containing sensor histidine kinase [Paenibacillus sp. RC67]|uniref:sensor histidine kinase n=1 Tax=Paenibacillus sp. RC67 TaxID=3039392 RepID=UPI0024ACF58D|nr:HAMP domain-containing sensor histidine kinase [Paenibacillus sp. RC67]